MKLAVRALTGYREEKYHAIASYGVSKDLGGDGTPQRGSPNSRRGSMAKRTNALHSIRSTAPRVPST